MAYRMSVISISNTPQNFISGATIFSNATFWGYSGFNISGVPQNNAGTVYISPNSGQMAISITAGSFATWALDPKTQKDDLSNYYIYGAAGDGVYAIWYR